jgi:hypothetical protein
MYGHSAFAHLKIRSLSHWAEPPTQLIAMMTNDAKMAIGHPTNAVGTSYDQTTALKPC